MITIKRLETQALIEDASFLLYQIYIHQKNWQFLPDNPSNLRIELRNSRRLLVDRFTERAVWFGAFDDEKLIGCVRLFSVDENNQLEVETYQSSQPIQAFIPQNEKDKCYDITKLAVHENYVGRGIVKRLFMACFRFCQENHFSAFACTHDGYLKSLFKKIEFPLKKEQSFKYEPQDTSAVNFYFADYHKSEVNETLKKLEYLENDLSNNARSIFKALHIVETILPTAFYWMNAQGVVLGINDHCLDAIGTTREIIGKKPFEFYNREIAEHILKHNAEVIRKEEILSQEEWIEDITTKERKCFSSVKAPLYDDEGTIIGIVGTSIEITAQKQAEALKLETERQKAALQEKERFIEVARKFAHDINSPIATLKMMMVVSNGLPEDKRYVMNKAIESVLDMTNDLLRTYKNHEPRSPSDKECRQPLLLSDMLNQLLSEKKVQYGDRPIQFEVEFSDDAQFAFAELQPSQFRRSMSNLINNAVEALEGKFGGIVLVGMSAGEQNIQITIEDNGKGMSDSMIQRVLQRQSFSNGKENGHGIGMRQVWDTLDNNEGGMSIRSSPKGGALIQLTFPRVESAAWLAKKIQLGADSIIVILDDDESIHGAWDARFASYLKSHRTMRLHHFTHGQKALDFFRTLPACDLKRVVFLSDFVLLRQEKNGLQIIRESGISCSTLVTSHYENSEIRDQALMLGIKILPKQMASVVPIQFDW